MPLQVLCFASLLEALDVTQTLMPAIFAGALLQTYSTGIPEGTRGPAAIFSPDSRYILSGIPHTLVLAQRIPQSLSCRSYRT